jgi:glutathione S-transferase
MSGLTIYGHYVSQPSRSLLWLLKLKRIDFTYIEINPSIGDTRKPEFLSKFPFHTIPAMECDGTYLTQVITTVH